MEYPHGHHHHHRRHEDDDDEEYPPPPPLGHGYDAPPPPFYGRPEPPPPFYGGPGPPPQYYSENDRPPPPSYHTSHIGPDRESYTHPHQSPPNFSDYSSRPPESEGEPHQRFQVPQLPPEFGHHGHQNNELAEKPSVKMFCKAETNYSLTIREGKVVLAPSNPSDPYQHWIKDLKFSTKVKDEEGFPSFALVNKATGLAMKHSIGATHPVQLIPYNPDFLDESILWTESRDTGDGYRAIRMVNNIRLNVDAFNGDKDHGGVRDGTTIVLWQWAKGENQRWKIVPY